MIMKLYKYRPINQSLFKELLYREIFLAKYSELNDPLDMSSFIDFKPRNKEDVRNLVHFVIYDYLIHNMRYVNEEINEQKKLEKLRIVAKINDIREKVERGDWIVDAFENELAKYEEFVTIDDLCATIEELYNIYPSELDYFEKTNEFKKEMEFLRDLFLNNSATACFTETNNDFLMWSHYADRHAGICIEFELKRLNDSSCEIPIDLEIPYENEPDIIKTEVLSESVRKVKYIERPIYTNFYEFLPVFVNYGDVDLHHLSKSYWHPYAKKLENLFLCKLKHWEYEKEWRIVEVEFKKGSFPENRILKYNRDALSGIIFGSRTTKENKHRIHNITNREQVKYYDSRILTDSSIEIIPINNEYFDRDDIY